MYSASLEPGFEGGACVGVSAPTLEEEWIDAWHVTLAFAHHVNVWFVAPPGNIDTFCGSVASFAKEGPAFIIDAARAESSEHAPSGGAIRIPSGSRYAFDVHTLNTTTETATSEITVDLELVPPSTVEIYPGTLNALNFSVPASSDATLSFSCEISPDVQLAWMSSHTHGFTSAISAEADGAEVYRSTTWRDPVVRTFEPPLAPKRITWTSEIRNTLPTLLTFGPSRDKNEMSTIYLMTLGAREWCIR